VGELVGWWAVPTLLLLYNVLVKKKMRTWEQSQEILSQLIDRFNILEIDAQKVLEATRFNYRYSFLTGIA